MSFLEIYWLGYREGYFGYPYYNTFYGSATLAYYYGFCDGDDDWYYDYYYVL